MEISITHYQYKTILDEFIGLKTTKVIVITITVYL